MNEKLNQLYEGYIDYLIKIISDLKDGKSVDDKVLYALQDSIRAIHHLRKMSAVS